MSEEARVTNSDRSVLREFFERRFECRATGYRIHHCYQEWHNGLFVLVKSFFECVV